MSVITSSPKESSFNQLAVVNCGETSKSERLPFSPSSSSFELSGFNSKSISPFTASELPLTASKVESFRPVANPSPFSMEMSGTPIQIESQVRYITRKLKNLASRNSSPERRIQMYKELLSLGKEVDSMVEILDESCGFEEKLLELLNEIEKLKSQTVKKIRNDAQNFPSRMSYFNFSGLNDLDFLNAISQLKSELDFYIEFNAEILLEERFIPSLLVAWKDLDFQKSLVVINSLLEEKSGEFSNLRNELIELDEVFETRIKECISNFPSLLSKYLNFPFVGAKKASDVDLANQQERASFLFWLNSYEKTLLTKEGRAGVSSCREMIQGACEELAQKQQDLSKKYASIFGDLIQILNKEKESLEASWQKLWGERSETVDAKKEDLRRDQSSYFKNKLEVYLQDEDVCLLFREYKIRSRKNLSNIDFTGGKFKRDIDSFIKWLSFYSKENITEQKKLSISSLKNALEDDLKKLNKMEREFEFNLMKSGELNEIDDDLKAIVLSKEILLARFSHPLFKTHSQCLRRVFC